MRFYLGSPETTWIGRTDVDLFISANRFGRLSQSQTRTCDSIGADSGAFNQVSSHGKFIQTSRQYADSCLRFRDRAGEVDFFSIQDWMCEREVIEKTGLSIKEHQRRTVQSFFDLKEMEPDLPWMPVLQGWRLDDYLAHADQYRDAGVDLLSFDRVGVGSVCKRKKLDVAVEVVTTLARRGMKLHGFGLKIDAFKRPDLLASLTSADSMAWSYAARKGRLRCGQCKGKCANCLRAALIWYRLVRAKIDFGHGEAYQHYLPFEG